MKIPYNILIQIKMSVRPYFKGFTLIFFFYNCRKQDHSGCLCKCQSNLCKTDASANKIHQGQRRFVKGRKFSFSISRI